MNLRLAAAVTALLALIGVAAAQELEAAEPVADMVAVADLEFLEDTGKPAAFMCYGEKDEDCHPWATFYRFEVRVRKVISGELPGEKFIALFGRHSLSPRDFKNQVIRVERRVPTDGEPVWYQITHWGEKTDAYCFSPAPMYHAGDYALAKTGMMRCYSPPR